MTTVGLCACGQFLHYTSAAVQEHIEKVIEEHGPDIKVTVGGRSWMVPRHFIALHGLTGQSLPALASRYSWPEVALGE